MNKRETTVFKEVQTLPSGERKYFEVRKSPIHDLQGEVIGVVAIGRDITEHMRTQEYLHYLGYHDALTTLYNRNYFEALPQKLLENNIQKIGMLICDVDGLKLVNDTMGHSAGDQRLKCAADILKCAVGQQGILARIGGDEFAAVICNATTEIMDEIVQSIKRMLEQENHNYETLPLNIAIGQAIGELPRELRTSFDPGACRYPVRLVPAERS